MAAGAFSLKNGKRPLMPMVGGVEAREANVTRGLFRVCGPLNGSNASATACEQMRCSAATACVSRLDTRDGVRATRCSALATALSSGAMALACVFRRIRPAAPGAARLLPGAGHVLTRSPARPALPCKAVRPEAYRAAQAHAWNRREAQHLLRYIAARRSARRPQRPRKGCRHLALGQPAAA